MHHDYEMKERERKELKFSGDVVKIFLLVFINEIMRGECYQVGKIQRERVVWRDCS